MSSTLWIYPEIVSSVTSVQESLSKTVAVLGNFGIVDDACKRIDTELEILSRASTAMRTLKMHRNALAAISRHLPTELLCAVFGALANILEMTDSKQRLQWIRVTHVCRHWRQTALQCPTLWSHIDISYPRWVLTMLGRSRMAPLVVKADINFEARKDGLLLALGHIARVRELYLSSSNSLQRARQVLAIMTAPAPFLEKLCISMPGSHSYTSTESFYVFDGDTPQLRHLELKNCSLFRGLPFCGLTHLEIHNSYRDRASLFLATKEFLASLREMRLLRRLCLSEVASDHGRIALELREDEPVVELLHLSSLQLSGGQLQCARFMSYLSFPVNVTLKLDCTVAPVDNEPDLPRLISVIGEKIGAPTCDTPLTTLAMRNEPSYPFQMISLKAWTTATNDNDHCPPDDAAQLSLTLRWDHMSDGKVALVGQTMCELLPMSHVHTLYFDRFDNIEPSETLKLIFRQLKEVRCLIVRGAAINFVDVLEEEESRVTTTLDRLYTQESESDDDDPDSDNFDESDWLEWYRHCGYGYDSDGGMSIPPIDIPFLPSLQFLRFKDTDFHYRDPFDDTITPMGGSLVHFLSLREDRGASVQTVELKGCRNLGDTFFKLQKLVEDFRWDVVLNDDKSDEEQNDDDEED